MDLDAAELLDGEAEDLGKRFARKTPSPYLRVKLVEQRAYKLCLFALFERRMCYWAALSYSHAVW